MRDGFNVFRLCSAFGVLVSMACIAPLPVAAQQLFGNFGGNPIVELDPGGERAKLLQNFSFKDDKNRVWIVPAGYSTDGASIPRPFWSYIGAPLTGQYRNASIIHDYFCDRRAHPWEEVHQVFYKGMRASNVGPRQAWVMYKAVYYFGPRWEKKIEIPKECRAGPDFSPEDCVINSEPKVVVFRNPITKDSFANLLKDLRQDGFGPEASELESKVKL